MFALPKNRLLRNAVKLSTCHSCVPINCLLYYNIYRWNRGQGEQDWITDKRPDRFVPWCIKGFVIYDFVNCYSHIVLIIVLICDFHIVMAINWLASPHVLILQCKFKRIIIIFMRRNLFVLQWMDTEKFALQYQICRLAQPLVVFCAFYMFLSIVWKRKLLTECLRRCYLKVIDFYHWRHVGWLTNTFNWQDNIYLV